MKAKDGYNYRDGPERRMQDDTRDMIQRYIDNGWEVMSRDPVIIQRGRIKKEFRNGILIDATGE